MITMPNGLADRNKLYSDLAAAGAKVTWAGPYADYCKVKCNQATATFLRLKYQIRAQKAKG